MRERSGRTYGVRGDHAREAGFDDCYVAHTRVSSTAVFVDLPSDRFTHEGRMTLTLEQWRAAHERTYGAA